MGREVVDSKKDTITLYTSGGSGGFGVECAVPIRL